MVSMNNFDMEQYLEDIGVKASNIKWGDGYDLSW